MYAKLLEQRPAHTWRSHLTVITIMLLLLFWDLNEKMHCGDTDLFSNYTSYQNHQCLKISFHYLFTAHKLSPYSSLSGTRLSKMDNQLDLQVPASENFMIMIKKGTNRKPGNCYWI